MGRQTERRTLHFDLSHIVAARPATAFTLHAQGREHPLQRHSEQSLGEAAAKNRILERLPPAHVTHFAEVDLPSDRPLLLYVTSPAVLPSQKLPVLGALSIHVPREARRRAHERRRVHHHGPHPKLLGAGVPKLLGSPPDDDLDVHDYQSAFDSACALLFHHPELMNLDPHTAATVMDHIEWTNGISDLADRIYQQSQAHHDDPSATDWIVTKPFKKLDGTDSTDHKYEPSGTTATWTMGPLKAVLRDTKNDPQLETTDQRPGCWSVRPGVTSAPAAPVTKGLLGDAPAKAFAAKDLTPNWGFSLDGEIRTSATADGGVRFAADFINYWFFWRSLYVQFRGPNGEIVEPAGWSGSGNDHGTKKFLDFIADRPTIMGIPFGPTAQSQSFAWPANASSAHFYAGGLGRMRGNADGDGVYHGAWDADVCTIGTVMTAVLNMALPTFSLIAGIYVKGADISAAKRVAVLLCAKILPVMTRAGLRLGIVRISDADAWAKIGGSVLTGGLALREVYLENCAAAFEDVDDVVVAEAEEAGVECQEALLADAAEGAAEKSEPIVGIVLWIAALLSDAVQLGETIYSIGASPAVFDIEVSRTMKLAWTLLPDENHQNTWPREATKYQVKVFYEDGASRAGLMTDMGPSPQQGPIVATIDALPAGGRVKLQAFFYSKSEWLCGQVETSYLNATPGADGTLAVGPTAIHENLIPLTSSTTYEFTDTLVYDAAARKHRWSDDPTLKPTATRKQLAAGDTGRNLSDPASIAISQKTSLVGYTWQASGQGLPLSGSGTPYAGQMYGAQVVDNREAGTLTTAPEGFRARALLMFDRAGAADGTGLNFWLEPESLQLRRLQLGSPMPFDFTRLRNKSWGKFNQSLDACVVTPSACAAGINTTNAKLEILALPAAAVADAAAPLADIHAGYGSREGLLHLPVGIAVANDGGLLVLESVDQRLPAPARVQAFDNRGNPVRRFQNSTSSFAVHAESTAITCLDIAVDTENFVFVLKYVGEGADVNDYLLDIYSPDGTLLSQTKGVSAARMCVDMWRALFTLNYGIVQGIDRTEPSVSIWMPSTP